MTRIRILAALACTASSLWPASECAECHAEISRKQSASRHASTLRLFEQSKLATLLAAPLPGESAFRYEYGPRSVTVRRSSERATGTLEWAFGAGAYGLTAVGRLDGLYYEHRVSFFTTPGKPGITPGHPQASPRTAADALGVLKLPQDIYQCFNCHATGLVEDIDGGPDVSKMTAGVTCERCHGPGQKHVAAARARQSPAEIRKAIFNSVRLPAKASVEVCGGCHRLTEPGRQSLTPEADDPISVRFQPMGLMASRCFREGKSLSCLTCHDPHQNAIRQSADYYVAKCMGCHSETSAPIVDCKRNERQDCRGCHMRKATPLPFLTFTDHRIRIYR
jgi:hypothetical protein